MRPRFELSVLAMQGRAGRAAREARKAEEKEAEWARQVEINKEVRRQHRARQRRLEKLGR
jgi:hypothetical protein